MLNDDPSTAVRRAQYSQHGWLPDFDCTAGECNWETDDAGVRRIVTYAGLGSHSNYPWETPLYVYAKVRRCPAHAGQQVIFVTSVCSCSCR